MRTKFALLTLLAVTSITLYNCGGGTPEETAGGGAGAEATKAAPAPDENAGGGEATLASGEIGIWDKDDWYTNKAVWVGNTNEFDLKESDVEGTKNLRANAKVADNRVRDLYIAKKIDGLEGGKTYKISLGYKFDSEKPGEQANAAEDDFMSKQVVKTFNYIQYAVQDGDQASRRPISKIEDYPENRVETTKYVDSATIGDGNFHTIEIEHTVGEGETSATLMLIARFRAETDINSNWLYLNTFTVEPVS
jgi:hypothetical protein